MRNMIVLALCAIGWVYGQSASSQPAFEVASIKPSAAPDGLAIPALQMLAAMVRTTGGGFGGDPGRITVNLLSLSELITRAYQINPYELSAPSWLESERFDITARIPDGASRAQVPLMMRNLLAERFHLTIHREKKEWPVYELVVGKNGPKLKEVAEQPSPKDGPPPPPAPPLGPPKLDANGFPVLPAGLGRRMTVWNGRTSLKFTATTMAQFAVMLSGYLNRPVSYATGLTGKYEVSLHFAYDGTGPMTGVGGPPPPPGVPVASTTGDDSGPTLFGSI